MAVTLSAYALTTVATVQTLITGVSNPDADDIRAAINWVSRVFRMWSKRTVMSASHTEYHDGDGISNAVILNEYPVTAISSIHVDTSRPPTWGSDSLIDSRDYVWTPYAKWGEVKLAGRGTWKQGEGVIRVIYTAGYAAASEEIGLLDYAAAHYVATILMRIGEGALHADQIDFGSHSMRVFLKEMPKETRLTFGLYHDVSKAVA